MTTVDGHAAFPVIIHNFFEKIRGKKILKIITKTRKSENIYIYNINICTLKSHSEWII